MSGSEFCGRFGTPSGAEELAPDARELIARIQRLAETPRLAGGYPIEWAVNASRLGDLSAIAALRLRSSQS